MVHPIEENLPDGTTRIVGRCAFTKEIFECTVPTAGFERWRAGERIQLAMPTVHGDIREFLISGISPAGWKKTFGDY